VAVGQTGPALRSTDGKIWTVGMTPTPGNLRRIAFGSVGGTRMFVAVGDNGLRVRSLDQGHTWVDAQTGFPGTDMQVTLRAIAIGNETVVVGGQGGRRLMSKDGKGWERPAAGGPAVDSILFVDGTPDRFLGYADNVVYVSVDNGESWDAQTLVNGPIDAAAVGVLGGSRLFVGSAGASVIKTSTNGVAWILGLTGGNPLTRYVFAGH
jgi:photosystem II stability/assembly factor-like uncharacterized protein